ncbi:MAG: hypothetical protein KAR13_12510, partial [Desulfobulbaceae bacterium]|nr:hypothetical protein [Desulfobulbaceae bacterium]
MVVLAVALMRAATSIKSNRKQKQFPITSPNRPKKQFPITHHLRQKREALTMGTKFATGFSKAKESTVAAKEAVMTAKEK